MFNGRFVRLEPLSAAHVPGLRAIAQGARDSSPWGNVPAPDAVEAYVSKALAMEALPFAIVSGGEVVGCTRLFDLARWDWQPARDRVYDACEIGYTWLAPAAQRTAVNTETKLLLLTHAFETWRVFRVTLKTDERNDRSRAAIARLGAHFDGILRAFQPAVDGRPRNTAYFTILDAEWPLVKACLNLMLNNGPPPVLGGCRVLEYAILDESVKYSGRSSLFVGGASAGWKEIGPVPCLAIGQELNTGAVMLLHCDRDWDVIARDGNHESFSAARERAERMYQGVSSKWIATNVSEADAETFQDEMWADERCSFCGKTPPECDTMLASDRARICNTCVSKMHTALLESPSK